MLFICGASLIFLGCSCTTTLNLLTINIIHFQTTSYTINSSSNCTSFWSVFSWHTWIHCIHVCMRALKLLCTLSYCWLLFVRMLKPTMFMDCECAIAMSKWKDLYRIYSVVFNSFSIVYSDPWHQLFSSRSNAFPFGKHGCIWHLLSLFQIIYDFNPI